MDMETTMMKWMGQCLFKAGCFRVMEVLNGDSGDFVWWSTLAIPATQEGEASDSEAQAWAAWHVLALKWSFQRLGMLAKWQSIYLRYVKAQVRSPPENKKKRKTELSSGQSLKSTLMPSSWLEVVDIVLYLGWAEPKLQTACDEGPSHVFYVQNHMVTYVISHFIGQCLILCHSNN